MGALAAMKTPDPAAKAILDDLFDRVLAAAAESGWAGNAAAPSSFPPGLRQVTLTRPGERMEVMAFPSPPRFVVIAMSFAESTG